MPYSGYVTTREIITSSFEVRDGWKYVNYTWPSKQAYDSAVENGDYIPKNNLLIGVKVWKDKFYFSLTRHRPGSPVALATAPYQPVEGNTSPNLQPYPNWEMQKVNDCKTSLQSVKSMEIDPAGRMWVLNTGHITFKRNTTIVCPHRLIIFDLENDDKILLDYEFPKDVVDPNTGYLNDLVLDHTDGGYAYITISDDVKHSIVVFSLKSMTSWQVTDESMKATDIIFKVKGEDVESKVVSTVNAIALEFANYEEYRALYFTPLSSRKLFYIHTMYLKSMKNISDYVHTVDAKPKTHTGGMMVNSNNVLFFGELEDNMVGLWDSALIPGRSHYRPAYTDPRLEWTDTLAIDEAGSMWASVNRMPMLRAHKLDLDKVNYWVVKLDQQIYKNYQYYSDGSAPKLPVIVNLS